MNQLIDSNSFSMTMEGKKITKVYPNDIFYNNKLKLGDAKPGKRKIDKRWIKTSSGFKIEYATDNISIPLYADNAIKYTDTYADKINSLHITPFGVKPVKGKIEYVSCGGYSGSAIVYHDAFEVGVDLIYLPTASDFIKIIRIKNDSDRKLSFKFKLDFDLETHTIRYSPEEKIQNNLPFSAIKKKYFCENLPKHDINNFGDTHTTLKAPITWDDFGNQMLCDARLYKQSSNLILEKNIDLSLFSSSKYVYSDLALSYKADSASGYIRNIATTTNGSLAGWNSIRENVLSDGDPNILSTNVYSNLTNQALAYFLPNTASLNSPRLFRSLFAFDTQSLSGVNIQSASLNFFFYNFENNTALNQNYANFCVTKGERLNPATLLEADWKKSGGLTNIEKLSNIVNYKDIITQIFTSMPLNNSGISHINKGGISDFSVRDSRDIDNVYSPEQASFDAAYIYSQNYSNVAFRPYLEIITGNAPSNIFAVNTVPIGNISKINSIGKANISSINKVNP